MVIGVHALDATVEFRHILRLFDHLHMASIAFCHRVMLMNIVHFVKLIIVGVIVRRIDNLGVS
jgi:hypothetical protein